VRKLEETAGCSAWRDVAVKARDRERRFWKAEKADVAGVRATSAMMMAMLF